MQTSENYLMGICGFYASSEFECVFNNAKEFFFMVEAHEENRDFNLSIKENNNK